MDLCVGGSSPPPPETAGSLTGRAIELNNSALCCFPFLSFDIKSAP